MSALVPRFWDGREDGVIEDVLCGVVGVVVSVGADSVRMGSKCPCGARREGGKYVMEWREAKKQTARTHTLSLTMRSMDMCSVMSQHKQARKTDADQQRTCYTVRSRLGQQECSENVRAFLQFWFQVSQNRTS